MIWPPDTDAVPIETTFGSDVESVLIATLTVTLSTLVPVVCIPVLYPEPLLPMAIEVIVPEAETIAVPPAATSGW